MTGKTKAQEDLEIRKTTMTNCVDDIIGKMKTLGLSVRESLIVLKATEETIDKEVQADVNNKPLSTYALNPWHPSKGQ